MKRAPAIHFPPFCLDPLDARLWQGTQILPLRPKLFVLLCYLVEHADRLIAKEELRKAVWPDTCVSEGLLKGHIRDLRKVLGDEAEVPRFIETVHGRGYRFIGKVQSLEPSRVRSLENAGLQTPDAGHRDSPLVGREAELEHLHRWLEKTLQGKRQIVFITGEPGIGKTTLVDAFLERLETGDWRLAPAPQASSLKPQASGFWIGRGQCIEHYSTSEAYLPILDALGRLCGEPEGERLIAILRQHAPLWLTQLPSVLPTIEREALQRQVVGATQERMLREMAVALEEFTTEQPLVLWLEDLHGSDSATLDLLAFLARRREPARLLVLGTYRPLVVRTREHPLYAIQRELQVRGQCDELALEPLSEGAVAEYLETRIAIGATQTLPLRDLARVIHQRTEGNPLFMVSTVEAVLKQNEEGHGDEQGGLHEVIEAVRRTVPASIRQFIEVCA